MHIGNFSSDNLSLIKAAKAEGIGEVGLGKRGRGTHCEDAVILDC
jgi:hypothetical protein